jgi:iron complex outermembrane receptor protein
VRLDGGSYGLLREHVALARQSGDWDVYAAATNQTGQGWRSQSQQNIQFGSLNIGRASARTARCAWSSTAPTSTRRSPAP